MKGSVSVKRRLVDTSHGQILCRTAGDGPPLLLLHPNSYSSELFADVIPLLGARYQVFALDRLGHGGSDPVPESFRFIAEYDRPGDKGPTFPYNEYVDIVVQVMDALGIQRTVIVGQHTGAHLGIEMGIFHPQRVEKMVLISVTDWESQEEREQVWRRVKDSHSEPNMDGSHLAVEWQQKLDWASPSTTPEIMDRLAMAALQSRRSWPTLPSQVIWYYHGSDRLRSLKVPTLIMTGGHDFAGRFTGRQATLLPSGTPVQSAVVEDVGAFFALEKPQEFTRRVLDFLGQ